MVVHEYEGDTCKGKECGFPQAEAYNVVVSADLGDGRRCCIHALTDEEVAQDSVAMELLRTSALILGMGGHTAEAAPQTLATTTTVTLAEAAPAPRPRARFFGVHQHTEVSSGTGCVEPNHHPSCDTLFEGFPETSCILISGTNPQKWSCVHSDTPA